MRFNQKIYQWRTMSRYDDLAENLNKSTILCSNLGFGEQGAILSKMQSGIFVCPDLNSAHNMKNQLDALNKDNVLIDDFDKPFTLSKYSSHDNKYDIIKALYYLTTSKPIIITTPRIFFAFMPDLETFSSMIINFDKDKEYDIQEIEKQLIKIGYEKVESVTNKGEFSRRGDIIDIFNIIDDNPTRLDFFDVKIENIYEFDYLSFEKTKTINEKNILPTKLLFLENEEKNQILNKINDLKIKNNLFYDIYSYIEHDNEIPLEFLYPFSSKIVTVFDFNIPIIISGYLQVENSIKKYYDDYLEKIYDIFKDENIIKIYKNNKKILNIDEIYSKFNKKLIFFDNFDLSNTDLKKSFNENELVNIDFKTKTFPSFLKNLLAIKTEFKNYTKKQIYLCLSSIETQKAIQKIFNENNIGYTINKNESGIILTTLSIPYNICFEDEEKFYIGSTNFAHKKEFSKDTSQAIKYLPKAGEYVIHSTHGLGKCEGTTTLNVGGVDKEFFKIIYRGGDVLYVPYENADCLSLYMAEGDNVNLNKLGGKEFYQQKLKAIKSIEDMSKELLELYAKRKATKGFKYSEDDYLYTEFENAFEYTETIDQLQAIEDVKEDMISGKVMDRLICGDVGFGKTEVAMRAMFKAVEDGKQVAILAPTTILSLQHFMTAQKRTKDFGVNVEMLNRFRSAKEQKAILEDLESGKINVICGTHRLLSKDVKFHDLGLLILDEEQRFGVKAKEQIKKIKTNVDVLTLSATPIPRTLSMTLMNIRDISIINTPPVDRLPIKTYVIGYNEEIILNVINDELKRDGQALIVYNNIEKLDTLANNLEKKLNNPNAHFDIAHGQMSEIALENAIKRLYDRETNVFVSTTLIENGIDLPKANTLIVIDSDRLGLSQMYQLRGRVGRNNEQAYAYFTYPKDKPLTEEASNRLQAIAENTDLGSGFKIAMRDLQIRGAGELLGKVQHGHMVKIGYDMYTKLLNDTLKRLKGEKVDTVREIKIDIAITSKIPYSFIEDEAERLKIIAKISNITNRDNARKIINELLIEYGKLPKEIYTLANITLMKSLAQKQKVKQIKINKNQMSIIYYDDISISELINKVNKFKKFKFENTTLPTISLSPNEFSVQTAMTYCLEFFNS